MASSIIARVIVEMEDGGGWDTAIDQRDLAAWEMQPFYDDSRRIVRQRFTAWSASARGKQTELTWPKFNAACVSVLGADDDEPESVDPT